ncbi:hypothetical protein D3C75_1158570 [compost metagenome]
MEAKKLQFWQADPNPLFTRRLQAAWPGWEVINDGSNYESQIACTYGRLQFQELNQLELLEQLKAMLLRESTNPLNALADFAKKEEVSGKKVEINPNALRDDKYELPRQVKEELLNEAIKKL